MTIALDSLISTVTRNCDVANARHAGDATLCVYLLRMREYFRWRHGLAFHAPLDVEALGSWLRAEETRWETIEEAGYERLQVRGETFDPFDAETINAQLLPAGYAYSAGFGIGRAAHFVLARLDSLRESGGIRILIAGEELARDAVALPAAACGDTVIVRRDAIRRFLWEKAHETDWHGNDTPMRRVMRAYDFDHSPDRAVARIADAELETFVQHELGEVSANIELGPRWKELLAQTLGTRLEISLRAVRDNLADALATLPHVLEQSRHSSVDFYFSTLGPTRKALQPTLLEAYEHWHYSRDPEALADLVARAAEHWRGVARQLMNKADTLPAPEQFVAEFAL